MFQNLDVTLFQQVIIGMIAVFIPFAISHFASILGQSVQERHFQTMVLNSSILGARPIFIVSVAALYILAFFEGNLVSNIEKFLISIAVIAIILFFSRYYFNILRYSEGGEVKYELKFLRNLKMGGLFGYRDKWRKEKMIISWDAVWGRANIYEEEKYLDIFIQHVDMLFVQRKYQIIIIIVRFLNKNIENRSDLWIIQKILPKLFEWDEELNRAFAEQMAEPAVQNPQIDLSNYHKIRSYPNSMTWRELRR